MKRCSYCGEQIDENIDKCPFCGSNVEMRLNSVSDETDEDMRNDLMLHKKGHSLSNGFKVFISMASTIPLFGQLVGIVMAIVYMNSEKDTDKRSFGKALLIGNLIFVVIMGVFLAAYIALMIITIRSNPDIFEQFRQYQK